MKWSESEEIRLVKFDFHAELKLVQVSCKWQFCPVFDSKAGSLRIHVPLKLKLGPVFTCVTCVEFKAGPCRELLGQLEEHSPSGVEPVDVRAAHLLLEHSSGHTASVSEWWSGGSVVGLWFVVCGSWLGFLSVCGIFWSVWSDKWRTLRERVCFVRVYPRL